MRNPFKNSAKPNKPEIKQHPAFAELMQLGEMEFVFEDKHGYSYFRMVDEQRIPAMRAFAAKDVWQEMEHRVHREALNAYFAAVKDLANNGELGKIYALTDEMETRSHYITHIGLLYKAASVLYFDQTEDPTSYSPVYAYQKIKRWQGDMSIEAFFVNAYDRLLTLFGFIEDRFERLYSRPKRKRHKALSRDFEESIRAEQERRYREGFAVVDGSLTDLGKLQSLGIYEFHLYIEEHKKRNKPTPGQVTPVRKGGRGR